MVGVFTLGHINRVLETYTEPNKQQLTHFDKRLLQGFYCSRRAQTVLRNDEEFGLRPEIASAILRQDGSIPVNAISITE